MRTVLERGPRVGMRERILIGISLVRRTAQILRFGRATPSACVSRRGATSRYQATWQYRATRQSQVLAGCLSEHLQFWLTTAVIPVLAISLSAEVGSSRMVVATRVSAPAP